MVGHEVSDTVSVKVYYSASATVVGFTRIEAFGLSSDNVTVPDEMVFGVTGLVWTMV